MAEKKAIPGLANSEQFLRAFVDDPPLFSPNTFSIALTKGAGFAWAMIPNSRAPDQTAAFFDNTEEVPMKDKKCEACVDGNLVVEGEKTVEMSQCPECSGYGYTSDSEERINRRTVGWCFDAGVTVKIGGQEMTVLDFWGHLHSDTWYQVHPTSPVAVLRQARVLIDGRMKPTERIARVETEVLSKVPLGAAHVMLEDALKIYKGLCWKIKHDVSEEHPQYMQGFPRHLLFRSGVKKQWVEYTTDPQLRAERLAKYDM